MKLLTSYTLLSISKQYRQEFGGGSFPPDVRQEVASHIVEGFVNEVELGNSWLA